MRSVALIAFLFPLVIMPAVAFPARAHEPASVILPIKVRLIGYEDAKQICCYSYESNGWCWQMAPYLRTLHDVVYDARSEPVPTEAAQCVR